MGMKIFCHLEEKEIGLEERAIRGHLNLDE